MYLFFLTTQADKARRGTVSNGQTSVNPGISAKKESIPEEKVGAVGGRDTDDDEDDDDD